jgi:HAE1 family hydrophobic/amphiphilic exporter-1
MKKFVGVCIERPVFAAMIVFTLVVVGAASYFRLGVDRFPRIDLPQASVRTSLPGGAVDVVETQITELVEAAVNTVEGISEVRSVSGSGNSTVTVVFNLDRDIDVATQDLRDRVAAVTRSLPEDALPPVVSKFNSDNAPAISIALSGNLPLRELTEMADKVAKPRLERSAGVGEVTIVGGLQRAINIWVDADRLAAYRLPISEVHTALARQNQDAPGGNVTAGQVEHVLRTTGRLTDPESFNDLVIKNVNGAPIRIRDIGWAEDGTKERRSIARLNGTPAVVLDVRRQAGSNTIEVINAVKENLEVVRAELPQTVSLVITRDQSRYINAALHEINVHLVLGGILASLVVFLFMRNWRATIIAAVAIPSSLVATFGMMAALDFTLNSVTMLALVLMVGIVIDNAIVVLENIFRFIEEKKLSPFAAARDATAEIALPVLATTLCLVVIFIPVSFMSSISGRFLYQFGLTAAVSILVSLVVSFTLTPMMSARLFRRDEQGHDHAAASRGGAYGVIDRGYTRTLVWALGHRTAIVAAGVVIILSSYPLYKAVSQEFIPSGGDEAEFDLGLTAAEGTSLAAMEEIVQSIERDIRSVPGVTTLLISAGGTLIGGVNTGLGFVRIAPHEERVFSLSRLVKGLVSLDPLEAFRGNYSQQEVMAAIRAKMRKYPNVNVSVRNTQSFNIGSGNFDIDFVIRGPELEKLAEYGNALKARETELGLLDPDVTLKLDRPELRAEIDKARAADLGIRTADIAASLRLMVGGDEEVTRYRDRAANEEYDVQLRLEEEDRGDMATIERLYVTRANGDLVRLDSVMNLVSDQSPSRVDRLDRERQISLRGGIAEGYALADRIDALRQAASELGMPPAYRVSVAGRGRELERTFVEFGWAFLLSVIFMYIVLASQYESLSHPLIILLSLPLSLPFAMLSLWLTGTSLSLYSALGMLVLFGVVAKNAILQVDYARNLRAVGVDLHTAVVHASRDRLRPILMTTLALVGGMLPMALGTGPGAEERRSIAVVVIGGQSLSLLLTLIVVPVVFYVVEAFQERWTTVPETETKATVSAEAGLSELS